MQLEEASPLAHSDVGSGQDPDSHPRGIYEPLEMDNVLYGLHLKSQYAPPPKLDFHEYLGSQWTSQGAPIMHRSSSPSPVPHHLPPP
jgi:hypothetical protein